MEDSIRAFNSGYLEKVGFDSTIFLASNLVASTIFKFFIASNHLDFDGVEFVCPHRIGMAGAIQKARIEPE